MEDFERDIGLLGIIVFSRMDARICGRQQDKDGSSPQSQPESPTQFGSFSKISNATSNKNLSHRKSSKAAQKRVISIPIRDSKGTRLKGEGETPPFDSWAWRKYGQKPIKGSPYPRGYYRCSSSKGCPARKQVELSRDDPTMLVVNYSCEHNHPWPAPRNNHNGHNNHKEEKPKNSNGHSSPNPDPNEKGMDFLPEGSGSRSPGLDAADEFGCFMDVRTTPTMTLQSPIFGEDYYHHQHQSDTKNVTKSSIGDVDVARFFPMREEDESLFSDLGELPECAVVFRDGKNNNNSKIC